MMLTKLSVLLLSAVVGCGGSLDQAGANKAAAAALTANQTAESQVRAGVTGMGRSGVQVVLNGGMFTVSGNVTSPGGGSASVSGSGSVGAGGGYSYSSSMMFQGWKDTAQDITLDGTLNVTNKVSITGMIPNLMTSAEATYKGDVQVSGSATGTASFDLTVKTTTSLTGSCVVQSGKVSGFTIDLRVGC